MTKFILAGGYVKKAPDGGRAFYEEMTEGFAEPVNVLDCMFARLEEKWAEGFEDDKKFFALHLPDKKIDLQLAEYDSFIEQIKWADAIYLRGGSSEQLGEALKEYPVWKNHLEGKTVAGTSAGADALSTYYYGLDHKVIRAGEGLVPYKCIPHFKSDYHGWEFDWDAAYNELKAYKEDLPILALHEGEFKVFELK